MRWQIITSVKVGVFPPTLQWFTYPLLLHYNKNKSLLWFKLYVQAGSINIKLCISVLFEKYGAAVELVLSLVFVHLRSFHQFKAKYLSACGRRANDFTASEARVFLVAKTIGFGMMNVGAWWDASERGNKRFLLWFLKTTLVLIHIVFWYVECTSFIQFVTVSSCIKEWDG